MEVEVLGTILIPMCVERDRMRVSDWCPNTTCPTCHTHPHHAPRSRPLPPPAQCTPPIPPVLPPPPARSLVPYTQCALPTPTMHCALPLPPPRDPWGA